MLVGNLVKNEYVHMDFDLQLLMHFRKETIAGIALMKAPSLYSSEISLLSTHQISKPLVSQFMSDNQSYQLLSDGCGILRVYQQQTLPELQKNKQKTNIILATT